VLKVAFELHVAALLALARCDGSLDTHLMVQRNEECLDLRDFLVVGLGRRGYRLAAVHVVGVPRRCFLQAHSMRGWLTRIGIGTPRAPEKKGLPEVQAQVGTITI